MTDYATTVVSKELIRYAKTQFVRYDEDGNVVDTSKVVTSSELGDCERKLRYSKTEKRPQPKIDGELITTVLEDETYQEGWFERGNEIEAWFITRLKEHIPSGHTVLHSYPKQATLVSDNIQLAGTPDAVIRDINGNIVILEVKSTATPVITPDFRHVRQTLSNMYLAKERYGVKIVKGQLIYVDASNWYKVKVFNYTTHDEAYDNTMRIAREKIDLVFDEDMKNIPYTGILARNCNGCQFKDKCMATLASDAQAGDERALYFVSRLKAQEDVKNIAPFRDFSVDQERDRCEKAVKLWTALRDERLRLEKEEKKYVDDAYAYIEANGGKYTYDVSTNMYTQVTVSLSAVTGRSTIDTELLEKDGIDVEKYKKPVKPYYTPRVKYA